MAQQETATEYDRYPDIFRTVQLRARALYGDRPLRILSFGCSYGLEMATLRAYFPDASIFGCDVSEDAMRRAALLPGVCVFRSSPDAVAAFAPFDIVFAMSVLCRFTLSRKAASIHDIFPFDEFEHHLATLDGALAEGGLLCVANANYLFRQSRLAGRYAPVRSALVGSNGFVDKWLADGRRLSRALKLPGGREHALTGAAGEARDEDFQDAIFQKGLGAPELVTGAAPAEGRELFARETGADLKASIEGRRVASRLRESAFEDASGQIWIGRQWLKSGVRGDVVEFPVWWTPGHREAVGDLSERQRAFAVTEKPARPGRLARILRPLLR